MNCHWPACDKFSTERVGERRYCRAHALMCEDLRLQAKYSRYKPGAVMKIIFAASVLLMFAGVTQAQSMSCRALPRGNNYVEKGETISADPVDGVYVACHMETAPAPAQAKAKTVAEERTDNRPRVFLTDSQMWSSGGDRHGSSGGSHPQNAELVKTFQERCPQVVITNKMDRASFTVTFEKEGGKGLAHKGDKIAVFNSDGDAIYSASTHSLGNAVKDACSAILSAK